jgi:cell division protease FtsH
VNVVRRPEFLVGTGVIVLAVIAAVWFNVKARRKERQREAVPATDSLPWGKADPNGGPSPDRPTVTFADVAGLDQATAELREVKEYLTDPDRFHALGAQLPRGILLSGPPGNGKTLLARALAGEAGVPFYFASSTSFVEQYVGLGAARIRQLFEEAKRHAPCIVFIDELDAIGGKRSGGAAGGREFDHTLNQLLVELDGFAGAQGVLLLGATNRPELLDPALVRPGRFDRMIHIDRPDLAGREAILRLYASRRPFAADVDWADVAHQTTGLTGAELANVVNEASLLAARRHQNHIGADDVQEAIARVIRGTRSSRLIGDEEKVLIAYHEAGHALLSLLLRGVKPPSHASIVSRSSVLSRSAWKMDGDREVLTQRELMAQLIVLLGGRAAEMNTFGEPSTRAEDDLEDAAKLARRMVDRWGMAGGFVLSGRDQDSGSTGAMDLHSAPSVGKLLSRAQHAARTILHDNTGRLSIVADGLVQRETLSITEIARLAGLSDRVAEVPMERPAPEERLGSIRRLHG